MNLYYRIERFKDKYFYALYIKVGGCNINKKILILSIILAAFFLLYLVKDIGFAKKSKFKEVSEFSTSSITCDSCLDCSNKLNGTYDEVLLTTDISNHPDDCIIVGANDVIFGCQGHTIDGQAVVTPKGVNNNGYDRVTIKNCIITGFWYGIYWDNGANYGTIINNTVNSNSAIGIVIRGGSNFNNVTNNRVNYNGNYGIYNLYSENNMFSNNIVNNNQYVGIWLYIGSRNNTVSNNIANNNGNIGIDVYDYFNTIISNTVNSNNYGIYLDGAHNNSIISNTVNSNNYGIYVYPISPPSSYNLIYNNYFNNKNNAYNPAGTNFWNTTKTPGINIVNGSYIGGNYWSDYTGIDTDGDDIGNTPYNIPGGGNKDHLPLIIFSIRVFSPLNNSYHSKNVPLNFAVNKLTSWIGYSLDDQANVTITGNTTLTNLIGGLHNVIVYANDTFGNMIASDRVYFNVISITIELPYNFTDPTNTSVGYYYKEKVPLEFTVEPEPDWIGYSVNSAGNVTILGNTTITGMIDASLNDVTVFANDTSGNEASSDKRYFYYCLADITGAEGQPDWKVDGRDLFVVSRAYGSFGPDYLYPGSPPHLLWNPDADLNLDNKVDGRDIFIVSRNYGKPCY